MRRDTDLFMLSWLLQGFSSGNTLWWLHISAACILDFVWFDRKGSTLAWSHHIYSYSNPWYVIFCSYFYSRWVFLNNLWCIFNLISPEMMYIDWNIGACLYGFELLKSRVTALFVAGASRVFLICFGVHFWCVLGSQSIISFYADYCGSY